MSQSPRVEQGVGSTGEAQKSRARAPTSSAAAALTVGASAAAEDGLLAVTVGATRRVTPVVGTPAVIRAAPKVVAPAPLVMAVIWELTVAADADGAVTEKATAMLPASRCRPLPALAVTLTMVTALADTLSWAARVLMNAVCTAPANCVVLTPASDTVAATVEVAAGLGGDGGGGGPRR